MHTAGHITEDGFHLKRVFEADVDVNSLAEHPAVGGQGEVGHHSVQHPAPGQELIVGESTFPVLFQTLPNSQKGLLNLC